MRVFVMLLVVALCARMPALAQTAPPPPPASRATLARTPQVVPTPPTLPPGGAGSPGGTRSVTTSPASSPDEIIPITGPAVPAAYARQTIPVTPCAQPPRLDGSLNDPCWQNATRATGFYPLATTVPIPPGDQTEVWVTADKSHLYVAFRCLDTHPGALHASETRHNGNLDNDDTVGIDIDSQNSRHGYSTFLVSARGTQQETLEGGTADNITWAGDWKAATRRTSRGWICEMSIPFALLRYPKSARAFGMDFFRHVARTSTYQNWPYLPPAGASGDGETAYIHEFTGFAPPFYAPRPVFLPYTLATAGTGNSVRGGMDIKYPLSTTLTGVATLYPDFQTIEQDVTDISFSYTEKLLTDHRPFFAEGRDFLPPQDVFYSRRIGAVDGGIKAVGKEGDTTIGFLGTAARGNNFQSDALLNLSQSFGLYSRATVTALTDVQRGRPGNQALKMEGVYGWLSGTTRLYAQASHIPTWVGGRIQDSKDVFSFKTVPVDGHPRFNLTHTDIGPAFTDNLGFVPETDLRGTSLTVKQSNHFAAGRVEDYEIGLPLSTYQHHTGGFFHSDINPYFYVGDRLGYSLNLSYDLSRRNDLDANNLPARYHDHIAGVNFGWGGKTLYQQGNLSDDFGRQAGQTYNYLSLSQGIYVSQPFNVQVNVNRLLLGSTRSTQAILTGTYRLNAVQTLGGRIVSQDHDTDIYFSFGQQVRAGTDIFVLFGDPNSVRTRGKITLKIVRPF